MYVSMYEGKMLSNIYESVQSRNYQNIRKVLFEI